MTTYPATPLNLIYSMGATGDPGAIAGTFPDFGRVDFEWAWGGIIGVEIVGFKIVFDATAGVGNMYWEFEIDNPNYPSDPQWTADTASHIGLNNSYDGAASAIRVNGPTHYEWKFYWPGDPTFGGFVFNDPVSDLLISLDRGPVGEWVWGSLASDDVTAPIVVSRFDLVLYTRTAIPPRRQYPYPATRVYPPPFSTRGGSAAVL